MFLKKDYKRVDEIFNSKSILPKLTIHEPIPKYKKMLKFEIDSSEIHHSSFTIHHF